MSSTMNAFVKASLKERENLETVYASQGITDYWFTDENGHDRYEGEFKTNGFTYIVEVKNRKYKSDSFKTTLIEQSKVKYLIEKGKRENKVPLLIIFFTDDKYMVFNLNNVKDSWKDTRYCNATSAVYSGKVDKSVYLIPITFDTLRDFPTNKGK